MSQILNDEELNVVTGGEKTGDKKDGKVYIQMPGIAASMSGYYDCDGLEKLAIQFGAWSALIASQVTEEIRQAVIGLYKDSNRTMPENVKKILGIK